MSPRERLLNATIELLQERGYARTTTRAIVARADAHLPAVNYYYGSKERLLEEAIVEALRRWTESSMGAAGDSGAGDPAARLERGLRRFFASLDSDRPYVVAALEAFAQAERSEELRARLAGAYHHFRSLLAAEIEATTGPAGGGVPAPWALDLASLVIAVFDGLAVQWLMDPEGAPDAEAAIGALRTLGTALTDAGTDAARRR